MAIELRKPIALSSGVKAKTVAGNIAVLLVALYLVILAFFVWLNSVTDVDINKSSQAIYSLNNVFSSPLAKSEVKPLVEQILSYRAAVEEYFSLVHELTKNMFPIDEIKIERQDFENLRITVPSYRFFKPKTATMRSGQRNFLPSIVNIITQDMQIVKVDLRVIIYSTKYQEFVGLRGFALEVDRADFISSQLLKHGLPSDQLVIGVEPSNRDEIILDFNSQKSDFGS